MPHIMNLFFSRFIYLSLSLLFLLISSTHPPGPSLGPGAVNAPRTDCRVARLAYRHDATVPCCHGCPTASIPRCPWDLSVFYVSLLPVSLSPYCLFGVTWCTHGGLSRRRSFSPSVDTDIPTDVPFAFFCNKHQIKNGDILGGFL